MPMAPVSGSLLSLLLPPEEKDQVALRSAMKAAQAYPRCHCEPRSELKASGYTKKCICPKSIALHHHPLVQPAQQRGGEASKGRTSDTTIPGSVQGSPACAALLPLDDLPAHTTFEAHHA